MKRIIIHWTGGTGQPNTTDLEHYHFIINKDGFMIAGKYEPEDNENCADGKYAQHTGKGNTGSIGIAAAGMCGFEEKGKHTNYPLTKIQCERLFFETARLCEKYKISITTDTVLTHYEFNQKHNIKTGKIDIIFLPPYPYVEREKIGDFIRNKVLWYKEKFPSSKNSFQN